jgi:hypothetical protein
MLYPVYLIIYICSEDVWAPGVSVNAFANQLVPMIRSSGHQAIFETSGVWAGKPFS